MSGLIVKDSTVWDFKMAILTGYGINEGFFK